MVLNEKQIGLIVAEFVEHRKKWEEAKKKGVWDNIEKKYDGVNRYPEYWDGYNFAANQFDAIMPHVRPDYYPHHLLSVRAPNQSVEQEKYIRANYKATTINIFEDFKSTISRSFADQNWSLKINEEKSDRFKDDSFQHYVNDEIEKYGSIESFMKSLIPTLKLTDANGIIAIKPKSLSYQAIDDEILIGEDGMPMLSNELINPIPFYYSCKSIVGQEYGKWYAVISEDESIVVEGGKNKRCGIVIEIYDAENIWKVEQYGKRTDFTFAAPVLYFNHNLGYVPCEKLAGTPLLVDNEVVFSSPFATSVPLLDQVILDESYLQISKATSAFPFRVMVGEVCEFQSNEGHRCKDGQVWNDLTSSYGRCPSCAGVGLVSRISPTGALLIRPKTSLSEGDTGLSGEYLKFVSPSMETLKFLRDEIKSNTDRAREVLHLPSSDAASTASEARTATGSLNKTRALYAFLKPISDQMFHVYEFILETIGKMRYAEYFGGVELIYPTTFDISTPSDYLAVIGEGIAAGVPPAVTYANVYNYIRAINYTDEESSNIYELIVNADELLMMSSVDILARIANGTYEKWQDVLHNSAPQLIMKLMREFEPSAEFESFFSQARQVQIEQLNQAAKDAVNIVDTPAQAAVKQLTTGL